MSAPVDVLIPTMADLAPSAPAGVEWVLELADEYDTKGQHERAHYLRTLAQQPAAPSGKVVGVEQRARELLEAECGRPLPLDVPVCAAHSAVVAALIAAQQQGGAA